MKKLIITLFIILVPFLGISQFVDDRWCDVSQFKHGAVCFTLSTIGGLFVYEASDYLNFEFGKRNASIISSSLTMGIGIWKETVDTQPSYKDLSFDLIGVSLGGIVTNEVFKNANKTSEEIIADRLKKDEKKFRRKQKRKKICLKEK